MGQQFGFSTLLGNRSLTQLKFVCPLIMTADRGAQIDFENQEYQPGSFVNIRYPNFWNVQQGNVMAPEGIQETSVPLQIQPLIGGNFAIDTQEASLFITKNDRLYHERYIAPVIAASAAFIETQSMGFGETQVNYFAGSPTSAFSSFTQVDLVNAQMAELGMPLFGDVNMVLNARDLSALKSDNQNAFNPTLNQDISFYSRLGRYSRFNLYQENVPQVHVCGSGAGTPLVDGTFTGGSVINLKGFTANAPKVITRGDIITFGFIGDPTGVQSINNVAQQATGQLMSVTAAQDYNADGAGNVPLSIAAPAIGLISDPANPRRNIDRPIANNTVVNIIGAGGRYKVGYAYTERGFALVMPKLPAVPAVFCAVAIDPDARISFRITKAWDGVNGLAAVRTDILWGSRFFDQHCIKIISQAN